MPVLAALSGACRKPWPEAVAVATISRMGATAGDTCGRQHPGPAATDRELAARLAAGERDALAEAYRQYAGLVFGVCRRVLQNETLAEDVTQEVFVSLWQHPERFDPTRGALRSWLGVMAHRRSIDRVRAESRRAQREAQCERSGSARRDVDDDFIATWLGDRVRDALAKLPAEQREVLVLAYYGDRTYRQVAVELAVPEGTVKSRVRLALNKLDTLLRSDFIDQDAPAWT